MSLNVVAHFVSLSLSGRYPFENLRPFNYTHRSHTPPKVPRPGYGNEIPPNDSGRHLRTK